MVKNFSNNPIRFLISPLAPTNFPVMPEVDGVELYSFACGIKNIVDELDLLIVKMPDNTSVGGVFTTSYTASSNVEHCRKILPHGKARVLIVNSGNSNVAVGVGGYKAVEEITRLCAERFDCSTEEVYFCSTGIIGIPLPVEKIKSVILDPMLGSIKSSWEDAADSITTTDTFVKMVTKEVSICGEKVTINGICKGSGMVAPNMATMLAYVFTNANIKSDVLQKLLKEYVNVSFNNITVDGDTSTSDSVLIFATNLAKHKQVCSVDDQALDDFKVALKDMLVEMAHLIVKDGEGVTKFIAINIKNATSVDAARKLGFSVANSLLVKTAIAGGDANWGRIMMAIGKAGEPFNKNEVSLKIGTHVILVNGEISSTYDKASVNQYVKSEQNIYIEVDINAGNFDATVWTCDLTHRFVDINGKYLT
ncbi:glutamate N-acetyltransferase/amino-acid acetyltransferase [Ehrlichia chaffeensis str. Heartland]|uniref:Arginine biosynthesis bifunctional protein ArgJ n=1 Tax=Ehrlichia chaffeensis (strain ATCC CRL-10679 / Arkansas) TaxID=205920 RepID=Q2GGF0_EHRCR|nr:bifunctional glutamate N-acetyltransferase/amino-acid acetyltransferase ArgJ [Ehrlichia chaffeensis]ABD45101.1 arginine biosynthesis bifunctional protein ArgJ [Ehrlichia chaffeensis str. Arkansas]AHX03751.1 glutamate N-acetyltransferase/amino-acid acetyltransferase [Ehrlichia chaffeensis str. Heartland]AHX06516.1 glutamate N-acetyltransferase/amino-acid acetyltransferase [Ehrlichia chaffeensis str. Liberty]AHX07381.1 glutamate N-acetyltransferase/amino-acid acetyltransferase [Ehrlichia chaff